MDVRFVISTSEKTPLGEFGAANISAPLHVFLQDSLASSSASTATSNDEQLKQGFCPDVTRVISCGVYKNVSRRS